jgi:hypothetical protein
MAGMEALGRLFNVIPAASAKPIKMRGASGVALLAWNATASVTTTLTLTQDSTFGGSFSNGAFAIKNVYWTSALDGTAAWNKATYNPGTAPWTGTSANNVSGPANAITFNNTAQNFATAACILVHVFTSELSDPYDYIKATMTGSGGLCVAILNDLVVQRGPANLEILGA